MLAVDNMYERGATGTTDWARYEFELDVAEEAVSISFGLLLNGDGTAWFDSLAFDLMDQLESPPTITVHGVVTGRGGFLVADAQGALNRPMPNESTFRARTDTD